MIKSKKIIAQLSSVLIFISCNSQEKKTVNNTHTENEKMKIEFNFYPSSGGNAIYTVDYSEGVLYVKNLESGKIENADYKKIFADNEIKKINQAVSELKQRKDVETEIILDSWRIELIIDGVIFYNESDVKLETLPSDIRNLLNLLIDESTVKIDLYGFS
jgi:hypothetical protein